VCRRYFRVKKWRRTRSPSTKNEFQVQFSERKIIAFAFRGPDSRVVGRFDGPRDGRRYYKVYRETREERRNRWRTGVENVADSRRVVLFRDNGPIPYNSLVQDRLVRACDIATHSSSLSGAYRIIVFYNWSKKFSGGRNAIGERTSWKRTKNGFVDGLRPYVQWSTGA